MTLNDIVLLGAGGQAFEAAGYCRDLGLNVVAYVQERPGSQRQTAPTDAPVVNLDEADDASLARLRHIPALTAVGEPKLRRRLVSRWSVDYATVCARGSWVSDGAQIGTGTTVAPLAAINRGAVLGEHVLVNVGSLIAHDCRVGDYVTLGPGTRLGGRCIVGTAASIGIGATIRDGIMVGSGAIVGAGAVVIRDVDENAVVAGVPARPIGSGV